jgi:hypothetical protein
MFTAAMSLAWSYTMKVSFDAEPGDTIYRRCRSGLDHRPELHDLRQH